MRIVAEIVPARREEQIELASNATGLDLLRTLRLAPDAHILVRHDIPITTDEPLANGDRVRVVAVVSGGAPT
jgi:sulfur carrier protein ThiS